MSYILVVLTFAGSVFAVDLAKVKTEKQCQMVAAEVQKMHGDEVEFIMCVKKLETI